MEVLTPICEVNGLKPASKDYLAFFGNFQYKVFYPSACLKPFVEKMAFFNHVKGKHKVGLSPLPNGLLEWCILLGDSSMKVETGTNHFDVKSFIIGLHDYKYRYQFTPSRESNNFHGISILISIKGLRELFGIEPRLIKNGIIEVSELGHEFNQLIDLLNEEKDYQTAYEILHSFFKTRQRNRFINGPRSNLFIQRSINKSKNLTVENMASEAGVSYRTLNRFFKESVGMPPKEYLKIVRFDKVCHFMAMFPAYHWSDLVNRFGYYDQAHFSREFKTIMGVTACNWMKTTQGHFYFNRAYQVV